MKAAADFPVLVMHTAFLQVFSMKSQYLFEKSWKTCRCDSYRLQSLWVACLRVALTLAHGWSMHYKFQDLQVYKHD